MNHSTIRESPSTRILGMILALVILALTLPISSAITEDEELERIITIDDVLVCLDGTDGEGELVQLHTVTSVGRESVKVNGVKSKNELLEYTIPDELLLADANFPTPKKDSTAPALCPGYSFILESITQAGAELPGCIRCVMKWILKTFARVIWSFFMEPWEKKSRESRMWESMSETI